jgi:hypothetical protein
MNEANDKLVLDAELALNADIAKVTGKTIGTLSGLEYSYPHASKTLIISKTSGAFNPADVAKVVEQHKIYLHLICHSGRQPKHPQSNHPSRRR